MMILLAFAIVTTLFGNLEIPVELDNLNTGAEVKLYLFCIYFGSRLLQGSKVFILLFFSFLSEKSRIKGLEHHCSTKYWFVCFLNYYDQTTKATF